MSVTKGHHCAYDAHYHVVFPVKYRKALLYPHVTAAIQEIAGAISERYEYEFERMGCNDDHIHLLVSFHPKWSGSTFVQRFKSITARELFRRFPELRKELWGGEFWTDGYYIGTVGTRGDWATVERYVANQGKTTGNTTQLKLWN
jgi:putative transposase